MYIKELVLDNFKSFGRKTRIPFYRDFTTVTGPNGSGKSNVIDAILFALGLARTSGIRAEKLTDLIYNPGHQEGESFQGDREASVAVVLDNSDQTLSQGQVVNAAGTETVGDVEEITIKRRVKETEENYYSYYYINDRSVNLGDIQDLLATAGVAPEGYNVVMQGDVTEIINMTPRARREIIDEIAGVAEFDEKKADAFDELSVVEERIEEAELRIEEKAARLDQLSDERETALQYQDLREQKETYESYRKAAELETRREERAAVVADIEDTEDRLSARQDTLDERQSEVMDREDTLDELNEEIERKGEDEQLRLKREIEEIKGDIARLEDTIESQRERIEDAENERRQAFVKIDRKQETVEDLDSDLRERKVEKSSVAAEIEDTETRLADVESRIDEVGEEFEQVKDQLQERKADLEAAKAGKNDLQREQDRLIDEARRRENEERETREALSAARERIPDLEAEIEDLELELEKAKENRETIGSVVDDLRAEKRERQAELEDLEDDLNAAQQEYAELEAKAGQNGDSSYGRAVTSVLNADIDGVHGAVAQLGSVSGAYATACETAAGGRLANVVVDDDRVGQRCIDHLKSRNAGRATFLPLTEMHQRSLPSPPTREGVVDFAYNLVDFDAQYAGIFSYVLGDTLVVEDIETARALMGESRLVTLDGDLVEKSGAMTGGSKSGSRYSFAGSQGQLDRVAARIQELEAERQSVREEIRDVETRLEDARDRETDAAEQVREVETDIEARQDDIAETRARIEQLETDLEEIADERAAVSAEMDELEGAIAEKNKTIATLEADIDELEAEVADSALPELTATAEGLREDIDDLEDRRDDLDGEIRDLELEREYEQEAIEDLREEIADTEATVADAEERIEQHEADIADREADLEDKEAAVAELESELVALKDERESLREQLRAAQERRNEAREQVKQVEATLEELRDERDRLAWEIDELESAVGEYDPEEIPDHETVEQELDRLEGEMETLEPVNMLAIEEYDRVEADLSEMRDQRETLVEEADGIRERIETYEARKKATFMDAYEAINEQFQSVFERLSNGTGRLHLENESDPFDGGLTMKAQPGDKPIQRLDAMSGGEKSLTALAFIFAIQQHNPAPFYALDEVDAFLDAANADLVGELVDELSEEAQFVVVSHRSAMLDRAERAIGVMMQDNNISAVTGIDLSGDAEVPADD
jgi:chromosome segregation protein